MNEKKEDENKGETLVRAFSNSMRIRSFNRRLFAKPPTRNIYYKCQNMRKGEERRRGR